MASDVLRKAREYERRMEASISEEERPGFHLSPRIGWMNDPNGFSYYRGKYHLFYQYHPYDTRWGPMHWGHAVSADLLHWTYLPATLAPDMPWDREGCFSGSALELPDGRHLLMYTGVRGSDADSAVQEQIQCIAVGDGENYEKYAQNPVIDGKLLPEGASSQDFRDPKLWRGADGRYYCVVGSRQADGCGQILLYRSDDGFAWEFVRVLIANGDRFGKMWECPDFFLLDGKWVLLTSPEEMLPEGLEFSCGKGTLCLLGDLEEETWAYTPEHYQAVDYGIDFYAPQTMLAPDGRRIMIGWMQNWETLVYDKAQKWFGQMTLPRELSIRNGRLCQVPVRELESLRRNKVEHHNVPLSKPLTLEGVKGRRIDLELTLRPADAENPYRKFTLWFAWKDPCFVRLTFDPKEEILEVDRSFSGTRRGIVHSRRCYVSSGGELKLRLILDRFSAEVFVNDGEQAMTTAFETPQDAAGIRFACEGEAVMDVVKYDLI